MNHHLLDIRPELATFATRMEQVLRDHDHKGGWQGMTLVELFNRGADEMNELLRAITWDQPPETIAREAADVANFMMMIADRVRTNQLPTPPQEATP